MKKKLLIWLFGAVGALVLVCGCYDMTKEMSDGEVLYRGKCSSCHNIISPSSYGKKEWRLHIGKYGQKISDAEKQVLLQYLVNSD